MAITLDYKKLPINREGSNLTVWIGPSGGSTLGITDLDQPAAVELNNTGGTSGVRMASPSISWNDWDFGTQASEINNEPSLADSSNYEEFGASNYGGNISFYYPREYDDNSNLHSIIYDLTDIPGTINDIAIRLDGEKPTDQPAANGDYVSTYRAQGNSEDNPFTPGESKRRTVGFSKKGGFAHYTIVGPHTITAVPPATAPWLAGKKARLRATVQGRDYTNALRFSTSDADVVAIYPGGFYEVTGDAADTATITITDEGAGTSATVSVTVT